MSMDQKSVRKIKVIVKGRTPRAPFEKAVNQQTGPVSIESLSGLQKVLIPKEPVLPPEKTDRLIDESRLEVRLENSVVTPPIKHSAPVRIKLRSEETVSSAEVAASSAKEEQGKNIPRADAVSQMVNNDVVLNGRYKVMGLVKTDSLRRVYLGIDQKGGQAPVKIIEILPPELDSKIFEKRSKVLMDSLRKLAVYRHPNAASVRDVFHNENSTFYVVDYIKGKNLVQVLNNHNGSLSEEEAADMGIALCDVLVFLQSRRIPVYLDRLDISDMVADEKGVLSVTNYNLHLIFDISRVNELIPRNAEFYYDQVTWVSRVVYQLLTGAEFSNDKAAKNRLKKMGKFMSGVLEETCREDQKKVGDLRVLRKMLEKAPIRTKKEEKDIQKFAWKFMKAG